MTSRPGFEALAPFFRIIDQGLSGLVDGDDFFDTLADDAVFEYVVSVPGYPRRVEGRDAVAELYRGYGDTMVLHGSEPLCLRHHDQRPEGHTLARLPRPRRRIRRRRLAPRATSKADEADRPT